MKWFLKCLKQYADFSGRARRREYWFFQLFNLIFFIVIVLGLGLIANALGANDSISPEFGLNTIIGLLIIFYVLALTIPSIAVTIRRLHDTGNSGWMLFISLIPLIGPIWLFILYVKNSQPGENKWGPNPKGN
tara:strand:- start:1916 stop:2314 length:399 start_codon:yes stop_codon:yes gene_type:complete